MGEVSNFVWAVKEKGAPEPVILLFWGMILDSQRRRKEAAFSIASCATGLSG